MNCQVDFKTFILVVNGTVISQAISLNFLLLQARDFLQARLRMSHMQTLLFNETRYF